MVHCGSCGHLFSDRVGTFCGIFGLHFVQFCEPLVVGSTFVSTVLAVSGCYHMFGCDNTLGVDARDSMAGVSHGQTSL